jgi:hypothetical protein
MEIFPVVGGRQYSDVPWLLERSMEIFLYNMRLDMAVTRTACEGRRTDRFTPIAVLHHSMRGDFKRNDLKL